MCFTKGVIKPTELLNLFQKKQENEFIWLKFAIMLNFRNEKVISSITQYLTIDN